MNRRRVWAWVVYAVSALLVVEALVWAGWRAWRAEREAAIEQAARLALWRMESVAVELLARESRRPAWHYEAYSPGAVTSDQPPAAGLVRSPLVLAPGPMIRLHAVVEPDGSVRSPMAPTGPDRVRALAELGSAAPIAEWLLTEERLERWHPALRLAAQPRMPETARFAAPAPMRAQALPDRADAEPPPAPEAKEAFEGGRAAVAATLADALAEFDESAPDKPPNRAATRLIAAGEAGAIAPSWVALDADQPALVLMRRATRAAADPDARDRLAQIAVVDWDALAARLTGSVIDLLPEARVVPMAGEAASGYPLATLPVALEPGRALPRGSAAGRAAVWTFSIAGLAVGAAVLAIGVVLRAALVNADRRARFVTGVTHELRTPLTALRLSSDLAAGAAARGDGAKAVELAERTREQARRLERIVASVLAYARASGPRGRAAARSIRSVLDDALPGVQALAREGGVELSLDLDEQALGLGVRLDPQDLERILSNLVENAGRYGRPAGLAPGALVPAAVTLRALDRGRRVGVGVRDRGPGVARRDRGRIFTAFEQGRAEGRGLGVGLGLALSRELARRSGARLRLREGSDGAWFEVVAPAVGTGVGELVEGDGVRR